jgi:hypothetical protein
MVKTTNSTPRHFAYRHPLFGTKSKPKDGSNSVYYFWWAFLKRSKEYNACCETGGKGKLSKLYSDFGDVRGNDFKKWWNDSEKGVRLFAEPKNETVRVLKGGERVAESLSVLALSLPLNLPKKLLLQRCKSLLAEVHPGKQGRLLARLSEATYKVKGQPNIEGLKMTLKVYDFRMAHPELALWEIGNQLPRFMLSQRVLISDTPATAKDKKNALAAAVGRYLKKAELMIESASKGTFPYAEGKDNV